MPASEASEAKPRKRLAVLAPREDMPRRLFVAALAIAAAALFLVSLGKPWWMFKLYAPQYPRGLTLIISLTGLGGDAKEIDTLNHYIGMAHLESAASFERMYAAYGVWLIGVTVVTLTLLMGKRLGWLIVVAGALFPLGFIADSAFWLYKFGHELDPHAPLNIPPFTPQLFGNGVIGQFMTFAVPQLGFWLAVGGVVLLAIVVYMRSRVCKTCKYAGTCGAVCRRGLVFPARELDSSRSA